eukprot:TRINITY_DN3104_c0_g1_i1.p1 TRINITY_DN3104_c0_g1~~TRINITY_DN3104_c0_g1_i1.p1  ORF type:complete len:297 (-),score=21.72 TRINITY_DN3104_c0_g1_i1:142-1032(-)
MDPDLTQATRRLVHNVAQYAHYKAQGKIGSGFDVSAAVYGSQVFKRFRPQFLASHQFVTSTEAGSTENCVSSHVEGAQAFRAFIHSDQWNSGSVETTWLPPGLQLMLGDVRGGTKTPLLVAKVTAWMSHLQEQGLLDTSVWQVLADANKRFVALFQRLCQIAQEQADNYRLQRAICSELTPTKWRNEGEIGEMFAQLHDTFLGIRKGLKQMGAETGTDIEPDSQTQLLNKLLEIPGVLLAGVPGAGGMDALFVITLSEAASGRVKDEWEKSGVVSPVMLQQDDTGLTCSTTPSHPH